MSGEVAVVVASAVVIVGSSCRTIQNSATTEVTAVAVVPKFLYGGSFCSGGGIIINARSYHLL